MVDAGTLGQIFSVKLGVYSIAVINLVAWWKVYPAIKGRQNERLRDVAKEKGDDWSRLREEITRLDARCDHLQKEVDECRDREAEWMRRAIAAEAASEGIGEARQAAQRIVSTERNVEREIKGKPTG